jgi:hypothetical protein
MSGTEARELGFKRRQAVDRDLHRHAGEAYET